MGLARAFLVRAFNFADEEAKVKLSALPKEKPSALRFRTPHAPVRAVLCRTTFSVT